MKPLSGITILDFSRVLAGPLATQIMAELGAEVIKIERPGAGDETRRFEPRLPGGESAYFFAFNRGKHSVCLDLRSPRGQQLARQLAADVDVVVENFLPDKMAALGLDFETLSARNPRLVYVSCTGFGQTGPYRNRRGYDTIFQAVSGLMSVTGQQEGPPAKVGVPISDLTSSLWIVIAVLAAVIGRKETGRGAYVDLSMYDVQVSLLALATARLFALDEDPVPNGTEHPGRVPSAAYACADGAWLQISGSDRHWPALCRVLGLDELADDERLKSNSGRIAHRALVTTALTGAIRRRDRSELAEALRAAGVPTGEVKSVREVIEDEHTRARRLVTDFDHPREGTFPALSTPVRFTGFDDPETGTPPVLGTATREILRARCGLSDAELATLEAERVI